MTNIEKLASRSVANWFVKSAVSINEPPATATSPNRYEDRIQNPWYVAGKSLTGGLLGYPIGKAFGRATGIARVNSANQYGKDIRSMGITPGDIANKIQGIPAEAYGKEFPGVESKGFTQDQFANLQNGINNWIEHYGLPKEKIGPFAAAKNFVKPVVSKIPLANRLVNQGVIQNARDYKLLGEEGVINPLVAELQGKYIPPKAPGIPKPTPINMDAIDPQVNRRAKTIYEAFSEAAAHGNKPLNTFATSSERELGPGWIESMARSPRASGLAGSAVGLIAPAVISSLLSRAPVVGPSWNSFAHDQHIGGPEIHNPNTAPDALHQQSSELQRLGY